MLAVLSSQALILLIQVATLDQPGACQPAVILSGDGALVGAVRAQLAQDRVTEVAASGCPLLHVDLRRRPRGMALAIEDGRGRRVLRSVSSVAAAGAVIESWGATVPGGAPAPPSPPPTAAPEDEEPPRLRAAAAPPPSPPGFRLTMALESALDTDRLVWLGASAGACHAAGPLCLGGLLRYAGDAGASGLAPASRRARTEWEGLLVAAWPLRLGPVRISPALGAGVGWVHASNGAVVGDSAVDDDRSLRLELSLVAAVPVGRGFSLAASLAAQAVPSGATVSEDGSIVQPRAYLRVGLGLHWGGP